MPGHPRFGTEINISTSRCSTTPAARSCPDPRHRGHRLERQGGVIDWRNFAGLGPLNTNYDLLSGPLGNLIDQLTVLFQSANFATGTDVAPAGYQLVQFLNSDGSTANTLGADLTIRDGFVNLAINAMDLADGTLTCMNSDGQYINPKLHHLERL